MSKTLYVLEASLKIPLLALLLMTLGSIPAVPEQHGRLNSIDTSVNSKTMKARQVAYNDFLLVIDQLRGETEMAKYLSSIDNYEVDVYDRYDKLIIIFKLIPIGNPYFDGKGVQYSIDPENFLIMDKVNYD